RCPGAGAAPAARLADAAHAAGRDGRGRARPRRGQAPRPETGPPPPGPSERNSAGMIARPDFTLGVEEEFQIIDPETRQLRSHVQEMLEEGRRLLKERVKPEMHQSVIELGTGICRDIGEVRRDIAETRTEIIRLASRTGMRVGAAGT